MDRDFMGNIIKDINQHKTKYDIEKQYWIEYSEELQERINKAIEYLETKIEDKSYTDNYEIKRYYRYLEMFDEDIDILLDILKGSDSNE